MQVNIEELQRLRLALPSGSFAELSRKLGVPRSSVECQITQIRKRGYDPRIILEAINLVNEIIPGAFSFDRMMKVQ